MKTAVIDFFAVWGQALSVLCSFVTAASALTALVHYLSHWREDEIRLAVEFDAHEPHLDVNGFYSVIALATITNVGKVAVTVTGFEIANKSLAKRFAVNAISDSDKFIDKGASVKQNAVVTAKERGVTVPEQIPIRVKWAKCGKNALGVAVLKRDKVGTARQ